jgi:multiple sugar transport system substrate-binding protein
MSKSRLIFFSVVGFLVIILVGGFYIWFKGGKPKEVTLNFWGVFNDADQYSGLIAKFRQEQLALKRSPKKITINYKKFASYEEYERALVEAWTGKIKGPDIFMIHDTWLPNYQQYIYPYPQTNKSPMNAQLYQQTFMPVASYDFLRNGQIYAIPLSIDTLALYYNKDILDEMYRNNPDEAWVLNAPKTWDDVIKLAEYTAQKDEWGNIGRSGIALGTANNIKRAQDILSLIMLQSGTQMVADDFLSTTFDRTVTVSGAAYNPGEQSLQFYTDFANPRKKVYTWNTQKNYSIDEFSDGNLTMMVGYSYLMSTIDKKNANLAYEIGTAPQLKDSKKPVNYANYWGLSVPRTASRPQEAWDFIEFSSRSENVFLFLNAANCPTARMDMISWQEKEMPKLGVFARQGLTAQSWYQINSASADKVFLEMIGNVNMGKATPARAINEASSALTLLMQPPKPEPKDPINPIDL